MKTVILFITALIFTFNSMAQEKIVQTAGREQLGAFAPEFARLNDDVLFGEVWSRNDLLSLRDRSLVTVVSLISQGLTDSSLTYHLKTAKKKESPVSKYRKSSLISLSMRVGPKHGRHSALPKTYGRKTLPQRIRNRHFSGK